MKHAIKILAAFAIAASMITFYSCSKDDEGPTTFTLASLTSGTTDLNGATSAEDVSTDGAITATFNTDVDASTATTSNITLKRGFDSKPTDITVTSSGKTVTITPVSPMSGGATYILNIGALKSTNNVAFTPIERSFKTAGSFAPDGVIAYYNFENNTNDVVGTYDPTASDVVDISYAASHNAAAGQAASFNGTTTLVEVPNASDFLSHKDFAISFWVKPTYIEGRGHFVLGLAAWYGFQFEIPDDYTWVKMAMWYELPNPLDYAGEDSFYPGDGKTKDNGGFQGWTINKNVTPPGVGDTYFKDKWASVVVTYDAETKLNTMYINGEPVKQHDFDLFPDDNPKKNATGVKYGGNPAPANELAFGFIQARENRTVSDTWADPTDPANKHFKGLLDEVRIYNRAISAEEVELMYESENQ
jgi:hypothetical protein